MLYVYRMNIIWFFFSFRVDSKSRNRCSSPTTQRLYPCPAGTCGSRINCNYRSRIPFRSTVRFSVWHPVPNDCILHHRSNRNVLVLAEKKKILIGLKAKDPVFNLQNRHQFREMNFQRFNSTMEKWNSAHLHVAQLLFSVNRNNKSKKLLINR